MIIISPKDVTKKAVTIPSMIVILDGNAERGTYETSNLYYMICLRHLIRPRPAMNQNFFSEKTNFPSCVCNMFWVTI